MASKPPSDQELSSGRRVPERAELSHIITQHDRSQLDPQLHSPESTSNLPSRAHEIPQPNENPIAMEEDEAIADM